MLPSWSSMKISPFATCHHCHILAIGVVVFDPSRGPIHLYSDPPLEPTTNENHHLTVLDRWTLEQMTESPIKPYSPYMLFPKSFTTTIACLEECFANDTLRYHISPFSLHDPVKYERNDFECAIYIVSFKSDAYHNDLYLMSKCKALPPGHTLPYHTGTYECNPYTGFELLSQIVARYMRQMESIHGVITNALSDKTVRESQWLKCFRDLRASWNETQMTVVCPPPITYLFDKQQPFVKRKFVHKLHAPGANCGILQFTHAASPFSSSISTNEPFKPVVLLQPNTNFGHAFWWKDEVSSEEIWHDETIKCRGLKLSDVIVPIVDDEVMQRELSNFMRSLSKRVDGCIQYPCQSELEMAYLDLDVPTSTDITDIPKRSLGPAIDEFEHIECIYEFLEHVSSLPNVAELLVSFTDIPSTLVQWIICALSDLGLIVISKRIAHQFIVNSDKIGEFLTNTENEDIYSLADSIIPTSVAFNYSADANDNQFLWRHWLKLLMNKTPPLTDETSHGESDDHTSPTILPAADLWEGMVQTSPIAKERLTHLAALLGLLSPVQLNGAECVDTFDLKPLSKDKPSFNWRSMNRFTDSAVLLKDVKAWATRRLKEDMDDKDNDIGPELTFATTRGILEDELLGSFREILTGPFQTYLVPMTSMTALWFYDMLNQCKGRDTAHCSGFKPPSVGRISAVLHYSGQDEFGCRSDTDQLAMFLYVWMRDGVLLNKLI